VPAPISLLRILCDLLRRPGRRLCILDLRFAAIVQFAVAVGLFGLVFLAASSWFEQQSTRRTWWIGLTSVPFAALAAWALSHSGIRQVGAGPLVPTWTVSGSHLAVLGREWLTRYSVILVLLGLLLLTGLVSLTYLIRDHWDPFQEKET